MSDYQTFNPVPILQPLPIPLPARFEKAFGLQTKARWVALYWEPQLAQACFTDGETVGIGNAPAWQLFCTHPDIKSILFPYHLGDEGDSAQHYLVLDRKTQRLYVGEADVVSDCLRHPAALEMLVQLDQLHRQTQRRWPEQLKTAGHKKWLLALVGALTVTLGGGLLYIVGEYVHEIVEEVFDD